MKNITTLGIDLAKNVFQLHGIDTNGKAVFKKRVKRDNLLNILAQLPKCLIGIEACGGSHYWARQFQKLGHEVKMMAPERVKGYTSTPHKNDAIDAESCSEAATRPKVRSVPIKTVEQQDIKMLHSIRHRLIGQRTQLQNHIRGHLAEYGLIMSTGLAAIKQKLPEFLEDASNELTTVSRELCSELYDELLELTERIKKYDLRIKEHVKQNEYCQLLLSQRGVGEIIASALVAEIGCGDYFKRGRDLSAYLGLVPKQHSSGNKIKLGGITKHGNKYIRQLLIHGARAAIKAAKNKTDEFSRWIQQLVARVGYNKAAVAVANKNARIAFSLLQNKETFNATKAVARWIG